MTPAKLLRLLWGDDEKQRPYRIALLLGLLVGLGLRIYNYAIDPPTLWQDEAYWAVKALRTEAIDAQIRPVGFMLVTQALLRVLGAAAWVYRMLPFLGSLVSMGLMPYVATRLMRAPWSRALAVWLLALSPVALEMAAEFKHYGVEIGVYVSLFAAFLRYREKQTLRSLATLLAVAWVGFFFSITIIFVYPALFSVLGLEALQRKNWKRIAAIVGVALACGGTVGTIYLTTWHKISAHKAEQKWGTWYDVFYIHNGLRVTHDSRLAWTTAKYFELAATPGVGRNLWESSRISPEGLVRLEHVDLAVWGALHLAGLAWLARRKKLEELALLWSPLLMVTAFNLGGRWPAGAFRTNTFFVPFAILLASLALDWLEDDSRVRRVAGSALACALLVPTLVFRPGLTEKGLWAKPGAITAALRLLPTNPPKGQRRLLMDYESCRPWDYYVGFDKPFEDRGQKLGRVYSEKCIRQAAPMRNEINHLLRGGTEGFWILLTDPRKFDWMQALIQGSCKDPSAQYVHGRTHLVLHCGGAR